jgi:hypothetical protein
MTKNSLAKAVFLLLLPVLLLLVIRGIFFSSPHHTFKLFRAAMGTENHQEMKRLSTTKFASEWMTPHTTWRSVERQIAYINSEKWQRVDALHADVTVTDRDGSFYQFYLLKTNEGWRVDDYRHAAY